MLVKSTPEDITAINLGKARNIIHFGSLLTIFKISNIFEAVGAVMKIDLCIKYTSLTWQIFEV